MTWSGKNRPTVPAEAKDSSSARVSGPRENGDAGLLRMIALYSLNEKPIIPSPIGGGSGWGLRISITYLSLPLGGVGGEKNNIQKIHNCNDIICILQKSI
jgi:hypothetical protein